MPIEIETHRWLIRLYRLASLFAPLLRCKTGRLLAATLTDTPATGI